MAGEIDIFLQEKKTGTNYTRRVRRNLLTSIKNKTKKGSGLASKSSVKPFYINGFLEKITIATPYYIYPILHVGFEGTKKNGIRQRLQARNIITDAVENGRLVELLATEVGENRAEAIVNRINFNIVSNGIR